jgi:tetratricopeptide (TPR) repeat protein
MKKIIISFTLFSFLVCNVNAARKVISSGIQKNILSEEDQRAFDFSFYEGLRLKDEGSFSESYEAFLTCMKKDSADAGLLAEISVLQQALGKNEDALKSMKKASELDPENWWYNTHLISMLVSAKKNDEAIALATRLVDNNPRKESAYNILIPLLKEKKQYDKAISLYDKLEKITGINERISFDKFRLFMLMNKPGKAYPEIDKLILKYPFEIRYKILKGDLLMQQKQNDKAFALYQQVLKDDPLNPYVYISLSEYFAQEGDNVKSMDYIVLALKNGQLDVETKIEILSEHLENLVKRDAKIEDTESLFKLLIENYPLEEEVHQYYASFLQYVKRDNDAAAVFESMLNINPKNAQTWFSLMQIYFSAQKYPNVISITDRAMAIVDEKAEFCFYKGVSLQLLEKYDSALLVHQEGLKLTDEKAKPQLKSDFCSNIADILLKINQQDSAFAAYDMALKYNPENIHALNNYAYYLSIEKRDLQKAERMSAKTIEKEPKNSTYLDTYAWIFFQQGNFSLSKFYIERALDNLKKDQDPGVIYEHYGDILWMSRNNDKKALEMWQKSYDSGNKTEDLKTKIDNQGWKR